MDSFSTVGNSILMRNEIQETFNTCGRQWDLVYRVNMGWRKAKYAIKDGNFTTECFHSVVRLDPRISWKVTNKLVRV